MMRGLTLEDHCGFIGSVAKCRTESAPGGKLQPRIGMDARLQESRSRREMSNTRILRTALAFGLTTLFSSPGGSAQSTEKKPLYLDAAQPIDKRVEDLLVRMTLSEKVGQMNMPCVYITAPLGKLLVHRSGSALPTDTNLSSVSSCCAR